MKFDVLNFEQIHKYEVGSLGLKSQRPPTKPRHVALEAKPAPRKIFLPKPKGVSLHTFVTLFLPYPRLSVDKEILVSNVRSFVHIMFLNYLSSSSWILMYIFHSSYFFQLRFFNLPGVRFPTKLTWTPTLRRPKPKELRQREMCKDFYSLSK